VSDPTPGARAVEAFQIEDVFLIASECHVVRDLNPQAPILEFAFGFLSNVEPEVLVQERGDAEGKNPFFVLRYYVNVEVRILKPEIRGATQEDFTEEKTLAYGKAVVAADYRGPEHLVRDPNVVGAFSRNAYFHAWPYLREEVHGMCSRLRVPRITLPMMKPDQFGTPKLLTVQEATKTE
jgi:hypothetical protein